MIYSLRRFLFISSILAVAAALTITAIGNTLLDKQVVKPYLDEQLIDNFNFIQKLNEVAHLSTSTQTIIIPSSTVKNIPNMVYQIWNMDGRLILHSFNTIPFAWREIPIGLSNQRVQNTDWRIYAGIDTPTHTKIIIAQPYKIRNKLTDLVARNNSYAALITYPIFALLIWLIIWIALRSMTRLTYQISHRVPTYLEPINADQIPIEVKPLVAKLNELLSCLKLAFEKNKRFAADAAHELRTPLAALKTQAQVALRTHDETASQEALHKVIHGVDRCSHIVAQLLTLSSISQEDTLSDTHQLSLHKLTAEVLAYVVPQAIEKQIDIELAPPPKDSKIIGNEIALGILIRNVIDNAIRYSPARGAVSVAVIDKSDSVLLRIKDTGPGIPLELRERVFDRFYRVVGTTQTGSGLGLAIVKQIAELHHAKIHLTTPENNLGLQIDILFSKATHEQPIITAKRHKIKHKRSRSLRRSKKH